MKGRKVNFSSVIQRVFLLGMMLLILPLVTKTTSFICSDLIETCIQYEADLESESESENSELTTIDDDFLFPVSSFLLGISEQTLVATFAIEIKNRITNDDPSPPPEKRMI